MNTQQTIEFFKYLTEVGKSSSKQFKGFYHLGGGYYSRAKGGEATHKSEKGHLKPLTPKEKKAVNKGKAKTKGQNVFGKNKGASVFTDKSADTEQPVSNIDPKDKLQNAIVNAKSGKALFDALDKLGFDEAKLMIDKVQAGPGGPVASTGETFCTEAQTDLITGRYNQKKERSVNFYKTTRNKLEDILLGDKLRLKKPLQKALKNTADKFGLYTENGTVDTKEALNMYAEAKTFVAKRIDKFKKTKAYKKFKNEEDARSWLEAAFYSSYSLMKNGPKDWNRKNGRVLKANARVDAAVFQVLNDKLAKAKTPAEKKHYQHQIKTWNAFKDFQDTYLVYTNKDGYITTTAISNKKSDELNDPQNNTTPVKRIRMFGEAVKEMKLNPKAVKIVAKAQDLAMDGAVNNDNLSKGAYKNISKNSIPLIIALSDRLPARNEWDAKPEYVKRLAMDRAVRKELGDKAGVAKPKDIVAAAFKIATDPNTDINKLSGHFTKFLIKQGQLAQTVFSKQQQGMNANEIAKALKNNYKPAEIQAILKDKSMKMLADMKAQHAAGLAGVHKGFIESLHKADGTKVGHTGSNGPAVSTYILGTMKALHIDKYVKNYDEDVIIEMGGFGVKSTDIRGCVATLSGYSGDLKSDNGKEKLIKHLASKLKVDSDSDAVYIVGNNGKRTYIASDTWRQAGSAKKIATSFGTNMRGCLKKSVGKRNSKNK